MCPQLLSRVKPKATVEFGQDSLSERPKLSPYIATVITTWSYCDAAYVSMLTHFLNADFRVVHEMLYALHSPDARRQVIQAAAEEALNENEEDLRIFNAVKKCTTASRTKRNDFAHKLWGVSPELPDALLLCGPKITTEYDIYVKIALSGDPVKTNKEIRRFINNFDQIYVYRENDLIREANNAANSCKTINTLLEYLSLPDIEERDQARIELLGDPQIQDCFASLSQKNNPESQPQ